MYIYLFFAMVSVGIGVLVATTAARQRRRATVERVTAIVDYGIRSGAETSPDFRAYLQNEPKRSVFSNVATWLGGIFAGRFTAVGEEAIREQLMSAGMYTVSPRTVLGYRVLATVVLPTLAFLLVGANSLTHVLVIAMALFAGWVLPLTYVQRKARKRIETIDRALPDLIDLLCVMIEAGLSFPAALRLASEQFGPPLGDELRLTLQEQTMGLSVHEALSHLADRAEHRP